MVHSINEVFVSVSQGHKGEHIITIRTCLNTVMNIFVGQKQQYFSTLLSWIVWGFGEPLDWNRLLLLKHVFYDHFHKIFTVAAIFRETGNINMWFWFLWYYLSVSTWRWAVNKYFKWLCLQKSSENEKMITGEKLKLRIWQFAYKITL